IRASEATNRLFGTDSLLREFVNVAEVSVSVRNLVVTPSTLGTGGTATAAGATYLCNRQASEGAPPVYLIPRAAPPSDCSGAPLFQPVDVNSDSSRRFFVGGIVGALAATLLVESLFFAETKSAGASPSAEAGPGTKA